MKEKQPILSKEFPQRLKHLRQNKGWSQGQLAKKLDVDTQRISKYEMGANSPPSDMMIRFAHIFEVSLDYLMCGQEEPNLNMIRNAKLVQCVEEIGALSNEDQQILAVVLDSFIKRRKFDDLMQS